MQEVRITRLGLRGDGVAEGPVFAARTLPGEVVRGSRDGNTLRDIRVVTPSADRVSAPCVHFKSCGGCALQHAHDDFVAEWKVDVVREALNAHGLYAPFRPLVTSPPQSRRRAGFAAKRTRSGALVGFHGRASDTIVAIPNCLLILPELKTGMQVAERLARVGASRKGVLTAQTTAYPGGLDVAVTGGKPLDAPLRADLAAICRDFGVIRLAWDDDVIAMETPPALAFGGITVHPPPGAFLQATAAGEAALTAAVLEIARGATRATDLFAGCGTFTLPLARQMEVHAVEGSAAMLSALDAGWRHGAGLKAVTTETRDLFRRPLLADELRQADLVVIDPPRAGAEAQIEALCSNVVPRIAHVSCNPVTFARDAARLVAAGYRLDWVQVVDQFRWSAHVELVACFSLPHIRG